MTTKNYKPYQSGHVDVTDGHSLYYELYGNPKGIPVLFLHGGPGAGFHDIDKEFFDEDRYNVLFFDQRGASKSKPFGSIENNTTQHLLQDINCLLDKLNFDKVYIMGGSWGSSLTLIYAINNPQRVLGMVVQGIWLANEYGFNHYMNGGVNEFFPDVWERFQNLVPKGENPVSYYLNKMLCDDEKESNKYAYEWAYFELSLFSIEKMGDLSEILETLPYKSLAILEAHYISNKCFISEDYIMNNINKVEGIETAIVQGRYDFICPPIQAFRLHSGLKNSQLTITNSGHAAYDTETKSALIGELKRITASGE